MNLKNEQRLFCENMKQLRVKMCLSKKEMAKQLGIGVRSLTAVENGSLPPRLSCDVLIRLYHLFGVAPKDMFSENGIEHRHQFLLPVDKETKL